MDLLNSKVASDFLNKGELPTVKIRLEAETIFGIAFASFVVGIGLMLVATFLKK